VICPLVCRPCDKVAGTVTIWGGKALPKTIAIHCTCGSEFELIPPHDA